MVTADVARHMVPQDLLFWVVTAFIPVLWVYSGYFNSPHFVVGDTVFVPLNASVRNSVHAFLY